jgi:sialic acid synthase SpsE
MLTVGGIPIGAGHPCRFVCEVGNAHNGDFPRALRLIDAAARAGAAFVKFQCYTPDELVALRGDGLAPEPWGSQGWTMRTLYAKAATPLEWFPALFTSAREHGLVPFASVFGATSLDVLQAIQCPAYKVAALDHLAPGWLATVTTGAQGVPVFVSSPRALHPTTVTRGHVSVEQVAWLYCPPGYPTPLTAVRLPRFSERPGDYLGLSSHCLAPPLPRSAVRRGAHLIEMHLMLHDEPSALEANVSLDEHAFRAMVQAVRRSERR